MSGIEFTQDDINSLAQKLSQVQPELDEQDYKLLLAIFAAAAARVDAANPATLPQPEIEGQPAGADLPDVSQVTPEELQQQLLRAYIPGNYFQAAEPFQDYTRGGPSLRTQTSGLH